VIVGSGVAGALIADVLAGNGIRVLLSRRVRLASTGRLWCCAGPKRRLKVWELLTFASQPSKTPGQNNPPTRRTAGMRAMSTTIQANSPEKF